MDSMKMFLMVLGALVMSCNAQKKSALDKPTASENSPLQLVLQDDYSGGDLAETLIIKDAKSLQRFFSQINRTRKPGLPVPDVDFTKNMIIVHCSGLQKGSGMTDLAFVEETDRAIVLHPVKEAASAETSQTAATSPFSLYILPLTDKEILMKDPERK